MTYDKAIIYKPIIARGGPEGNLNSARFQLVVPQFVALRGGAMLYLSVGRAYNPASR